MNRKYGFIILEGSLELVPKELHSHPSVIASSKRRRKKSGEIILDKSLHYKAMITRGLRDVEKRGRPDIVHHLLLNLLESPLNKSGLVSSIYLHTVTGSIYRVDPSTRIPRNYNRFIGLMEQVLKTGKAPPDSPNPLIEELDIKLEELSSMYRMFIVFEEGCRNPVDGLTRALSRNGVLIGIGGFPHGSIKSDIIELADECFSLSDKPLEAITSMHIVLCIIESRIAGLY
jgi:rRNA small subunit pseudouridine methyltransferase Nep1